MNAASSPRRRLPPHPLTLLAAAMGCASSTSPSDAALDVPSGDVAADVAVVAVRAPPLRLAAPAGFAPDTLYFGADIYQSSRTGAVLEEMMREASLPAFCVESPSGQRAQWMLGAVIPWNVMVDDPTAWSRVKSGLDAARAAGVPMHLHLDVSRSPMNLAEARDAEARGERTCTGSPCAVPFAPTSAYWDAAARWQADALRELDTYLGDPVVLVFAMGEPSLDVARWTLPVPAPYTAETWVPLQLRLLEQRMIASLRRAAAGRVSVSIRHMPWFLTSPENQRRWGVRPEDFNAVCDETLAGAVLGVDVYETPGGHSLDDSLGIAQGQCTRFQSFFAAELGVAGAPITRDDFGRWVARVRGGSDGRGSSLLGASVYCWNCVPDPGAAPTALGADQRRWLGEAFRGLVDGPTRACASRCTAHPTWSTPATMTVALGAPVDLRAAMPARCDEVEVFVQPCCHTTDCASTPGVDEDADCPLLTRGVPMTSSGAARVTFDATTYRPGWVRVRARGAGAPGAPPSIRVRLTAS